jgi:hypothetical protein
LPQPALVERHQVLGDKTGAESAAEKLSHDRRIVVSAIIAVAVDDPRGAATVLEDAVPEGTSVAYQFELSLLRASIAIAQGSARTRVLVRDALSIANRHGFVQTVLDTAPRLVDHLITDGGDYPRTGSLQSLEARR